MRTRADAMRTIILKTCPHLTFVVSNSCNDCGRADTTFFKEEEE